ncbi:MAG: hypothetical protein K6E98_06985 [Lachnospiraceae bacterium]|nr:hypothetical protein [Lachnospiraceae bacterium]
MSKESKRSLKIEEKYAIQQMGWFWRDWLYLKESDSEDYFIAVNKYHPTQTKRIRKIQL